MYSNSIITRRYDGKKFKVTFLSHWSDIESEDGLEKDSVKWYGNGPEGELYVGHSSKQSYFFSPDK